MQFSTFLEQKSKEIIVFLDSTYTEKCNEIKKVRAKRHLKERFCFLEPLL